MSRVPIAATQVHYNLQVREPEAVGLLQYCQQNGVALVAWRPLNQAHLNKSGTNLTKVGIPALDKICRKYGRSPAQVALNWLISQKNVVAVVKASNTAHLLEDLGAVGWTMEIEDSEFLRSQFPDQRLLSDNQPLR